MEHRKHVLYLWAARFRCQHHHNYSPASHFHTKAFWNKPTFTNVSTHCPPFLHIRPASFSRPLTTNRLLFIHWQIFLHRITDFNEENGVFLFLKPCHGQCQTEWLLGLALAVAPAPTNMPHNTKFSIFGLCVYLFDGMALKHFKFCVCEHYTRLKGKHVTISLWYIPHMMAKH